jgi:hypothetical protein
LKSITIMRSDVDTEVDLIARSRGGAPIISERVPSPFAPVVTASPEQAEGAEFELRQLGVFEAVARYGSFSRAAVELNLSRAAISMQMKQLEEQIWLPLIHKVGKRLFLTAAGQELRGYARQIVMHLVDLRTAMDEFRRLETGVIRIAVIATANYFLPPLIASFNQRYPGVSVRVLVGNQKACPERRGPPRAA